MGGGRSLARPCVHIHPFVPEPFFPEGLAVAALYLNCKAIFFLLAFICVFPHLSETPFLSPLKSILTTEQT